MVGRTAIRLGLEEFDIVLEDFKLTSLEIEGADGQAYDRGTYSLEYLDYRSGDTITETERPAKSNPASPTSLASAVDRSTLPVRLAEPSTR